jgi:D-alanyl-lipoteichoic acid acyltransferase DltB (MBOAT superfamily)
MNKWVVRYLYVPLGGASTQIFTIWIIFSFIGLWHDLQPRWLAWALLNCVFFSIEIVVMKVFGYSEKVSEELF